MIRKIYNVLRTIIIMPVSAIRLTSTSQVSLQYQLRITWGVGTDYLEWRWRIYFAMQEARLSLLWLGWQFQGHEVCYSHPSCVLTIIWLAIPVLSFPIFCGLLQFRIPKLRCTSLLGPHDIPSSGEHTLTEGRKQYASGTWKCSRCWRKRNCYETQTGRSWRGWRAGR